MPCSTKEQFLGVLYKHAKQHKRSFKATKRYLWGLACRIVEYNIILNQRVKRKGLPSYAEHKMMEWATETITRDFRRKEHPSACHFSLIFNRDIEDAKNLWSQNGPAKGRESFGL